MSESAREAASRLVAGMRTRDIRAAAKSELDSTHRVYVLEWVFDSRHNTVDEANARANGTYGERLRIDHTKIEHDDEGGLNTWVLWVKQWNVRGEWKRERLAWVWREMLAKEEDIPDSEIEVVARNSRREHQLRAYGKVKIAQG